MPVAPFDTHPAPGIFHIIIEREGKFSTTPYSPLALHFRKPGKISITPFKPISGYFTQYRNMYNVKIEAEILNINFEILRRLFNYITLLQESDTAVILPRVDVCVYFVNRYTSGANTLFEKYIFPSMGLDFEIKYTPEGRSCNIIFERAYNFSQIQSIIDAADSSQTVHDTVYRNNVTNYYYGTPKAFFGLKANESTEVDSDNFILKNFDLKIKTKSVKDINNVSIVTGYDIDIAVEMYRTDVTFLLNRLARYNNSTYFFRVNNDNANSYYDVFEFRNEVVKPKEEIILGDEERTIKLNYVGFASANRFSLSHAYNGNDYQNGGLFVFTSY